MYLSYQFNKLILYGGLDGYIMCPISQSHFHLSFIFIKMNFIHFHSCVMFVMKSIYIYNDQVNYDDIIIQ